MVSRSEGAELAFASKPGPLGDRFRICPGKAALRLGSLDVLVDADTAWHECSWPAAEHLVEIAGAEPVSASPAGPCGYRA